jgi:hypothetical protein
MSPDVLTHGLFVSRTFFPSRRFVALEILSPGPFFPPGVLSLDVLSPDVVSPHIFSKHCIAGAGLGLLSGSDCQDLPNWDNEDAALLL